MIEIRRDNLTKELSLVDGIKQFDCDVEEIENSNNESTYSLNIWDKNEFDYVLKNVSDNPRIIAIECPWYENWQGIKISARVDFDLVFSGLFRVSFDNKWKWKFSPESYFTEFASLISDEFVDVVIDIEDAFISEIRIFTNESEDISLASGIFFKTFSLINKFHSETVQRIEKSPFTNSILSSFMFPKNLKITCEQYLLYFAKFLYDLGINATSDLKEEAGKVLFSITPVDDVEALDKIREALSVYLKLPESPIIFDESFKSMRLQQQIENLQHSQRMAVRELQFNEKLLAAQSDVLHEKNLTISQLQTVNEQQQKIIEKISSKSIMMDSVENKEELEELYEGLKVGESKWLKELTGIGLNPAKAIKTAVKNTFGKEDKKSILGLDED